MAHSYFFRMVGGEPCSRCYPRSSDSLWRQSELLLPPPILSRGAAERRCISVRGCAGRQESFYDIHISVRRRLHEEPAPLAAHQSIDETRGVYGFDDLLARPSIACPVVPELCTVLGGLMAD